MFPTFGLFAGIVCPFFTSGHCERPYCFYRHAADVEGECVAKDVEFSGQTNGTSPAVCGPPVVSGSERGSLQELERLNKEIETVRHEVEKEQRRLSRYQIDQTDSRNSQSSIGISKSDMADKHVDQHSRRPPAGEDLSKTYLHAKKYVVDSSKPRTDLEYDPLSNYSADLCSHSSLSKNQRMKNGHGVKRAREIVLNDQKKPLAGQEGFSRSPSPELPDDSREEDVLIIDIPPSPAKKRGRSRKDSNDGADMHVPVSADSPKHLLNKRLVVTSTCTLTVDHDHTATGEEKDPCNNHIDEKYDGPIVVVDISQSLEESRSKCSNVDCVQVTDSVMEKTEQHPAVSDCKDFKHNNPAVEKERSTFCSQGLNGDLPFQPEKTSPTPSCTQSVDLFPPHQRSQDSQTKDGDSLSISVPPSGHKIPSQTSGLKQDKAANHGKAENLEQISEISDCSKIDTFSCNQLNLPSASQASKKEIIVIESSSEEEAELNYSDIELSDSDPMEECYRIFIEANQGVPENGQQPPTPISGVSEQRLEETSGLQTSPGKSIFHQAEHTELVGTSRDQPQVLAPSRVAAAPAGFASQHTSRIHQVQQEASALMAAAKGGQAFSSTLQKPLETATTANKPAPAAPHRMNYVSLGTGLLKVGHNLHLILPDGSFPLSFASGAGPATSVLTPVNSAVRTVTPVLTPISQLLKSPLTPKTTQQAVAHRYCTAPTAIISPAGRKAPLASTFAAPASSSPVCATTPQPNGPVLAKPMPSKRRAKYCETAKDKVPHDVRQRYVNSFTEEFLKTTANVNDAFEKALAEERAVYNRSINKLKYLSVAVNALKKLKNQSVTSAKAEKQSALKPKGNIPLSKRNLKGNADSALYACLMDYALSEGMLIESNYPVQHPERPSCAALFADSKSAKMDSLKRICCRCGATYAVNPEGKHTRKEECNYHHGKGVTQRVPGGVETRYSCCQGVMGSSGCQTFKLHVHDALSLDGFVSTPSRGPSDPSCAGVYAVDCDMCYTIHGLELARVTVVNSSLQVVFDKFVQPEGDVIDYNTRFSGICEDDVRGVHSSLKEVQQTLLSFIYADTILIGHGLERDLCALKLIHGTVVDTSVVFPHRLGPPHKLTIKKLTADYLRRIIQESVCGHDAAEDAAACMELMLWKAKEDGKLKK